MQVNCASVQLANQPRLWSSSVHWLGDVSHFCLGIRYLGCMHNSILTMTPFDSYRAPDWPLGLEEASYP